MLAGAANADRVSSLLSIIDPRHDASLWLALSLASPDARVQSAITLSILERSSASSSLVASLRPLTGLADLTTPPDASLLALA